MSEKCVAARCGAIVCVTERDAVLRERKAFAAGAAFWEGDVGNDHVAAAARRKYPLPRVTRPRVIADNDDDEWRVIDGVLQWRYKGEVSWRVHKDTREFSRAVADLWDNPTETVEDDA